MTTVVRVNRRVIWSNRKHGRDDPPVCIETGTRRRYAHEVEIRGPCRLVYRPHAPLKCGAQLWIETEARVVELRRRRRAQ